MKNIIILLLFFSSIPIAKAQVYDSLKHCSIPALDSVFHRLKEAEQYNNMLPYMQTAAAKAKQLYGEKDTIYARILYQLAFSYDYNNNYEQGMQLYQQASSIQKDLIPDDLNYANTLFAMADIYNYNWAEYNKALPLYIQANKIFAHELGNDHPTYATSVSNLAALHEARGNFEAALPLYNQAKNIFQNKFGKTHPSYATALSNLAVLNQKMGHLKRALPLLIQAKEIREKSLGKDHPHYATALNNLAALHEAMGNYESALPLYTQCADIDKRTLGDEHINVATSLNNLAFLYQKMGNSERALPLYIQCIKIEKKVLGTEHPSFATSLNNLATLHQKMGNFERALPLYIQAINIREKTLGKQHPNFAKALHNLAFLHKKMGNFELALPLLIQAVNIKKKALGNDHPSFATSLNNLASLHQKMGNFEAALPLYIQAVNIQGRVLGNNHPTFAEALHNLAFLYKDMGNFERARLLFDQCIQTEEKALGKNHPQFAFSLNNLTALHIDMGNYEKAWTTILKSIEVASNLTLSPEVNQGWADSLLHASYASNLHINVITTSLALVYDLLDKTSTKSQDKRRIIADLAIQLLNKLQHQTSNEKDKLRILEQTSEWVERSLLVLKTDKHCSNAFALADKNKSVLLFQATKSEAIYKLGNLPDSLAKIDKKMINKQHQLEAKLIEKRSEAEKDSLRSQLIQVNQDLDDFAKMIKKKHHKYHLLKYAQVHTNVESIQALLDDQTILLEYLISDSLLHIFKVSKNNVEWLPHKLNKNKLNNNIKEIHEVLKNYNLLYKRADKSYKKYTKLAHWFYLNLLEPILGNDKNIKNLIIVSDGELGHLPFESFLVENAPQSKTDYHQLHYLLKDYNISYNYSATLWKENKNTPPPVNNGQILGIAANYTIKLDPSMKEIRLPTEQWTRAKLSALPAARKEVETLQEKYQGYFAYDTLASEKTVKKKASDFAILHFATHGILDKKRPVLSSLAFTEDNDSIESNFWQAHEISKMELNADLVVLSACETGYGKFEKGNGIASLARAFMYAGSPALIVSLWQVNDYATSEIMRFLYDNLANGMMKDEALRQAKLQYMKSAQGILAHPAYWSPFIMIGNTEPVAIKTKEHSRYWVVGGMLAFFVLAIGFSMSKLQKNSP